MYNNIQTIRNKYGFDRIEAKGNISLLDNVLTKRIGIVGAKNATSHARMAAVNMGAILANHMYGNKDDIIQDFTIVTRLTTGVDIAAHMAALYNPTMPTMKHRTIAIIPDIHKTGSKICNEIIKSDGLIISPIGHNPFPTNTKSHTMVLEDNVDKLLVAICDAIVICDIDKYTIKESPYDATKLRDPYRIYIYATPNKANNSYNNENNHHQQQQNKKIYLCNSVEDRIQKQLNIQGMSIVEIHNDLAKLLYQIPTTTTTTNK